MLEYGRCDGQQEVELWHELRDRAAQWFHSCLGCDASEPGVFQLWMHSNRVTWIRTHDVVVFMLPRQQKHVVEVHVTFLHASIVHRHEELLELLMWLFAIGWKRIEVPVLATAGHTLRRLLREMGFQHEGTMRGAQHFINTAEECDYYVNVEMWAILREGDSDGIECK